MLTDEERIEAIIELGEKRRDLEDDFKDHLIDYGEYLDGLEELRDEAEDLY